MNKIRRYCLFLALLSGFIAGTQFNAAAQLPRQTEPPFAPGEKLHYRIRYGFINAANGTLSVHKSSRTFQGQPAWHLKAEGSTVSAVALIMKVRNRYNSYINTESLKPFLFTESVKEGNYTRDSYVRFDRKNGVVNTNKGVFDINKNALDVLSAFYYARSLDISRINEGQTIKLYYFIDDEQYSMVIKYLGKETIKTQFGRMECLKFTPSLIEGRIFRDDSDMFLWISNDANRVPVKAKVEILVGSITLELRSYENLKYPLGTSLASVSN